MTVGDLIRELQALPQHARVELVMREVYVAWPDGQFAPQRLSDEDAVEVDEVRHMGAFVLIRSK